jgi:hypothetical protein
MVLQKAISHWTSNSRLPSRRRGIQSYHTYRVSDRMRLNPERPCGSHRVDALCAPPNAFIAGAVKFAMMAAAQRHGELVADLEAETPGLGKAHMMGIARLPATDQAGLPGDKAEVGLVAVAAQLGEGQHALVDSGRFDRCRRGLDLGERDGLVGPGANSRAAASAASAAPMSRSLA